MRKWLAWVLVLALCLSVAPGAFAAEQEEAPVLSEYTWDNAMKLIGYYGLEGVTGSVPQVGLKFWRLSALQRVELTQEMTDAGYLAAYTASDCTLSVILQDYDGIDLEEYQTVIEDSGYKNVQAEPVNGRDFVIYDEPQRDGSLCRVAATQEPEDQILEFVFYYKGENEENVNILLNIIIASIQSQTAAAK